MATFDSMKTALSSLGEAHETELAPLAGGPVTLTVLFADVAGSTKLYDALGDIQAKAMVDECIDIMRAVVAQYGGRVIKTIGDEVMCVLPKADTGLLAATDMQTKVMALPVVSNVKRAIRVGFHFGPVIEDHNDVFGDTVNVAARMAGLARQSGLRVGTARLAPPDQCKPRLAYFFRDFFGVSLLSHPVSDSVLHWARSMAMQAGLLPTLRAAHAFSHTDFRMDMDSIQVPTLIIHGTEDKTVPIAASANIAASMLSQSEFIRYEGAAHGILASHKDRVLADMLDFLRSPVAKGSFHTN